jgi:sec-independent protein translocase protein TatA
LRSSKSFFISLTLSLRSFVNDSDGFLTSVFLEISVFIVLLVFGADKIPSIAKGLAKGMTQIKQATNEIKTEISKNTDVKNPSESLTKDLKDSVSDIKKDFDDLKDSIKRDLN